MDDHSEAVLLRIFIGESDHWHGKSLHLALVEKAREQGLAGATGLRGSRRALATPTRHGLPALSSPRREASPDGPIAS